MLVSDCQLDRSVKCTIMDVLWYSDEREFGGLE